MVLNGHFEKDDQKLGFKTDYRLMQVKSIREHSAVLSTFIKLPFVIKIFVLSIFEWPLRTGFTVKYLKILLQYHICLYKCTVPTSFSKCYTMVLKTM